MLRIRAESLNKCGCCPRRDSNSLMVIVARHGLGVSTFLPDAFKRLGIGLLIDELPGVSVALSPAFVDWVEGLRATRYGTVAVTVARDSVASHGVLSLMGGWFSGSGCKHLDGSLDSSAIRHDH